VSKPISRAEMKDVVNEIWQKCLEEPVGMKYKDIKDFWERCDKHPDHQNGMISYSMIERRLREEIEELRQYIEQREQSLKKPDTKREWVGLTKEEAKEISLANRPYVIDMIAALEARLKEKNT